MAATAVTVSRHHSELGWWEMASRDPHPLLAGQVLGYTGYVERTNEPLRRLEAPFAGVVLILSFGKTLRVVDGLGADQSRVSFVGGLSDAPTYTEHGGDQHGIQINLTPLAARALLAVPMDELTNRVVELDDVVGREADQLLERLHDVGSWEQQFSLLDAVLAHRLAEAEPPQPAVRHAWSRLVESRGAAEIRELSREVGWSRRHLAARFREEIGLTPKTYARVLRFERAASLLAHDDGARFAEIAYDCGYYDQAHLNRDFREFAGTTPGDYVGRLLPDAGGVSAEVTFVQDGLAAAA
jgi:AraC-like DNA-binding protein